MGLNSGVGQNKLKAEKNISCIYTETIPKASNTIPKTTLVT